MKRRFYDNPSMGIKILLLLMILLTAGQKALAQFYSAKVDALELSIGTFNAEGSMAINERWSLHLPVYYNPWTFSDNKKIKHLTVLPGARYWVRETYGGGFFFGGNAIISRYNFSGVLGCDYRYDGMGYGLGISAGYSIPLKKQWNIEFELGGGAIYGSRDKYPCIRCGKKIEKQTGVWMVPDKVAVAIVYLF